MKLKTIVTTLGVIGLTTAGFAFAGQSTDAQVAQLQAQLNQLQSQVNAMSQGQGAKTSGASLVQLNSALAQGTLSTQTGVGTEMTILNGRKSGAFNGTLFIGGQVKGYADYTKQTVGGTDHDASGMHIAPNTGLAVLANVNSWVSAFVAVEGFDENSDGSTKDLSAPMAYLTFGNLNTSPVYGFVGRKDIDFGSFQTVSFFTNPENRDLFEATGDTLGVGYTQSGFNGTVSVANGGDQKAANNTYTKSANQISNVAVNASYSQTNAGVDWKVGAGYLTGSFGDTTTATVDKDGNITGVTATGKTVGAWDINAQASVNNLTVMGEFDRTADKVNTVVTDGTDTDAKNMYVEAWDVGAAYAFPVMGKNSSVDVDYSAGKFVDTISQYVVGYNVEAMKDIWVGAEYTYARRDSDNKSNQIALVGTAYF